jgi:hypothetical protein
MDRRQFIKSLSLGLMAGPLVLCKTANALLQCTPYNFQGIQQCEAGIDSSIAHVTAMAVGGQHMNQWCWAACIEMIFRHYGYIIPQEFIVQQTWGGIVNLPSQPDKILMNLNRPWVDANGNGFGVSGDVFSANHVTAAQDLSQDMPLIIGTMGHAMILTSLRYLRNQLGQGDVIAAIVRDPWPGRNRRVLSTQEWYSTSFLVRIRVFPM